MTSTPDTAAPAPTAGRTAAALDVEGLHVTYGDTKVLDGVSFQIAPGQLLALLGPSGCGKTTTLRMVAGLDVPDAGLVRIGGVVATGPDLGAGLQSTRINIPPHKRGVGLVFQDHALFPHLSAARNVGYGLARKGRKERVAELLELVGLTGLDDAMPDQLSGGQQQRIALARALAPNPAVLLMDEPFSSLDARMRDELRRDVRRILHDTATTALFVTHDQEEALSLADAVAVMREGRIEQIGSPTAVHDHPTSAFVASFVGDAQPLAVTDLHVEDDVLRGTTELGPVSVTPRADLSVTAITHVLVRPDQVVVELPDETQSQRAVTHVRDVEYFGHDALMTLALASGTTLRARSGPGPQCRAGAYVTATIDGPALAHAE